MRDRDPAGPHSSEAPVANEPRERLPIAHRKTKYRVGIERAAKESTPGGAGGRGSGRRHTWGTPRDVK